MVTSLASKPDYLKAVGLITAEWNAVEHSMAWVFNLLAGCEAGKSQAIFYAIESNRARREITVAIAQVALANHPDLLRRIGGLLDRTRKAAEKRNIYAHALWGVSGDGTEISRGNTFERIPVALAELEQAAAQMAQLQNDFALFIRDLFALGSSPQKP